MLTALLATATSFLFGMSDFLGGVASRRDSALRVTANAQAVGWVLLLGAALLFRAEPTSVDLAWGAVAGISGGFGVAALYAGLAVGRMSIVAPIAAALSGALPALVDLFRGVSLSAVTLLGMGLALAAVVVVGAAEEVGEDKARVRAPAIFLAVAAGLGFAGSFVAFSMTGLDSGMWPLLTARTASVLLVVGLALVVTRGLVIDRSVRAATLAIALFDAVANVTMLSAIRIGPLAVASVLGSLYPAVVVVLAYSVLGERLKRQQQLGIALAIVAVVLTAIP